MNMWLDILLGLLAATLVLATRPFEVEDLGRGQATTVKIQRFDGDLDDCRTNEVCADVFRFNRTLDNGTLMPEMRFIQNCRCPETECGDASYDPLVFRETQTQSMITCFPRQLYLTCPAGAIAKEQHNIAGYRFYRINCVCPHNNDPLDFHNRMTDRVYQRGMGRSRLFACRNRTNQNVE